MKKAFLSIVMLVSVALISNAQFEEKMKKENVVMGEIYQNGKATVGYIKKKGSVEYDGVYYDQPWLFQKNVRFIPKDDFEKNEKIKGKLYAKYDAKDLDGYKYDTLVYKSVKYADMSAVGTGMIAKKVFLRKISEGKISLYHYYMTPPPVGEVSYMKEETINCQTPNLVYQKGEDGKPKLVTHLNINKELADCPVIIEKYGKKDKDSKDEADNEQPSGVVKDLLLRESYRLSVIEDYNNNCL